MGPKDATAPSLLTGSPVWDGFWIFPLEVQVFAPSLAMLGHIPIPEPTTGKECTTGLT